MGTREDLRVFKQMWIVSSTITVSHNNAIEQCCRRPISSAAPHANECNIHTFFFFALAASAALRGSWLPNPVVSRNHLHSRRSLIPPFSSDCACASAIFHPSLTQKCQKTKASRVKQEIQINGRSKIHENNNNGNNNTTRLYASKYYYLDQCKKT